jgi:excisionase family DNA binding protein
MSTVRAKTWVRPSELASALDVHPKTIVGWIHAGELRASRSPKGTFRIPASAAKEFLKKRNQRLPGVLKKPYAIVVTARAELLQLKRSEGILLRHEPSVALAVARALSDVVPHLFLDPKCAKAADFEAAFALAGRQVLVATLPARNKPWSASELDAALARARALRAERAQAGQPKAKGGKVQAKPTPRAGQESPLAVRLPQRPPRPVPKAEDSTPNSLR